MKNIFWEAKCKIYRITVERAQTNCQRDSYVCFLYELK